MPVFVSSGISGLPPSSSKPAKKKKPVYIGVVLDSGAGVYTDWFKEVFPLVFGVEHCLYRDFRSVNAHHHTCIATNHQFCY